MNDFFFQFNKSLVHSISDETGNYDGSIHLWNLIGHMGIVDEMAQSLVRSNKHLQNDNNDERQREGRPKSCCDIRKGIGKDRSCKDIGVLLAFIVSATICLVLDEFRTP